MSLLDPDRQFPADPITRGIARDIFESIEGSPIISPHGHCDPSWFATDAPFANPAQLFVVPDHYIFRMLVSQGVSMTDLGVPRIDGGPTETDGRKIWRIFASHYHLFRGTPTRMWIDHSFETLFDVDGRLSAETADKTYDQIAERLQSPEYRPRALFKRFGLEVLATTDSALDGLDHHKTIQGVDLSGRVVPTYRPDAAVDPEFQGFAANVKELGEITGCDTSGWEGYLGAHRKRRIYFRDLGATATDHGHPTAHTENLPTATASDLFERCLAGNATAQDAEMFRAQMLTEMAKMSVEDGLTMQIHAGSFRNHSAEVLARHGRDMGFDIPQRTDYVHGLKPMLDVVGMEPDLTIILFTLDESVYARELAPLTGVYPALKLGPPWWFFDSADGMARFRNLVTETAGIYNTVGFNDDTRAFCSIPSRHDVARRADAAWLAELVAEKRIDMSEAMEMAADLTVGLAKKAYRL